MLAAIFVARVFVRTYVRFRFGKREIVQHHTRKWPRC